MLQTSMQRCRFLPKQPKENTEKNTNLMIFLDSCHLYNADIPKLCYYYNLPILTTFSREACLGRIKYLPLLALSYSGIPVKELYYLFLWQITSKLNLILIIADYQYVRQICIRILIILASCQQITSKLNYARRGMRLRCQNDLFVPMITPNT